MTATGAARLRQGSGFISRDNDDPIAEAVHTFMKVADIARKTTVLWNVIPWWNGTRRITQDELKAGTLEVQRLISLLPELRVVVLVGRKAQRASPYLPDSGIESLHSDHPSPIVRARLKTRWDSIPHEWAKVRGLIPLT